MDNIDIINLKYSNIIELLVYKLKNLKFGEEMKRYSKCVFSEIISNISFDENNVCNYFILYIILVT